MFQIRRESSFKAPVPLSRIFFRLFTVETIDQSRTIWNRSTRYSFLSKRNRYHPHNILNHLRISRKLYSFCLINLKLSRIVSVKCSETVVMNLHIIGNTFVNIRISSHTLHFHHSNWFQIVRDCWIYLYSEKSQNIFGQVGPANGFCAQCSHDLLEFPFWDKNSDRCTTLKPYSRYTCLEVGFNNNFTPCYTVWLYL